MNILIVATSKKPPNWETEIRMGQRYRLEYLELCHHLSAAYMDYDPPWMHNAASIRNIEEKLHVDFYWASHIARKVERQGFDVVLSMSERVAVPLAHLLNKRVRHIAILINALSPKWLYTIKALQAQRRWAKIVTYSQAEAEALQRELHLEPGKIQAIHNYVDTEFFEPVENDDPQPDEPFILSQGLAKRDYPTLIQAMRELPHIACHISAVSAWDRFQTSYRGVEIPGNVHLKAYDHPMAIRNVLSRCRFVVIPLLPDVGMWCSGSTSVLQTQAMGKPIIVTYLPGISEYVRDGDSGFLVEGNNPEALAEKIDYLWKSPQRAKAMGECGRSWVRENFSLGKWIHKMVNCLEVFA